MNQCWFTARHHAKMDFDNQGQTPHARARWKQEAGGDVLKIAKRTRK